MLRHDDISGRNDTHGSLLRRVRGVTAPAHTDPESCRGARRSPALRATRAL